eukprot:7377336-Prymnesium_polylepis.1
MYCSPAGARDEPRASGSTLTTAHAATLAFVAERVLPPSAVADGSVRRPAIWRPSMRVRLSPGQT